jgi:hypothetical protein
VGTAAAYQGIAVTAGRDKWRRHASAFNAEKNKKNEKKNSLNPGKI